MGVQVVKTGVSQAGRMQIIDGLHPGDKVVTDGLDRLRDGARIRVAPPPGQERGAAAPQERGAAAPKEHGGPASQ